MPEEPSDFNWERAKVRFKAITEEYPTIKDVFPEISISLEAGAVSFRREQTLCLRKDNEKEFHFDYYINHVWYKEACNNLKKTISRRNYEERTYYNSDYWKQRTRITNEKDFEDDLVNILGIIIATSSKEASDGQDDSKMTVKIANDVPLDVLLSWNLNIPDYQRPYCWREANVRGFLQDISQWQSEKEIYYHAGTIILKEIKHQNESTVLDIVDGQQRITTLALWLRIKQKTDDIKLLHSNRYNYKSKDIQTILRAGRVVDSINDVIDLSKVIFSVVILGASQSEDLAYTFFSNSNSTGKRLSDYDLLKTHHLRYIETDKQAEFYSKKWNNLEQEGLLDDLLQKMLFRLRKWNNREWFAFESGMRESHDLFLHFKSVDPLQKFPPCNQTPFRFSSRLSGGKEFFTYTEYYSKKYEEFNRLDSVKMLNNHLSWASFGVLYSGIKAIAFLYYCKFGELHLKEAIYCLSYRLSVLRNEYKIQCKFLGEKPIFQEITQALDQVTSEAQFFALLCDVKKRYHRTNTGKTATWYWEDLDQLLNLLSQPPFEITPIDNCGKGSKQ